MHKYNKAQYDKEFNKKPEQRAKRAELNKYNRKKGTYGNGDGLDASHIGGKIVGFESENKNRGRAEKSRLKTKPVPKRRRKYKAGEDLLSKYYGSWSQKQKAKK